MCALARPLTRLLNGTGQKHTKQKFWCFKKIEKEEKKNKQICGSSTQMNYWNHVFILTSTMSSHSIRIRYLLQRRERIHTVCLRTAVLRASCKRLGILITFSNPNEYKLIKYSRAYRRVSVWLANGFISMLKFERVCAFDTKKREAYGKRARERERESIIKQSTRARLVYSFVWYFLFVGFWTRMCDLAGAKANALYIRLSRTEQNPRNGELDAEPTS